MLKLKNVSMSDGGQMAVTYEVVHNVGTLPTTLTQELELSINPETGEVTGNLVFSEYVAANLDDFTEKMADWCDRMAAALRQKGEPVWSVPVFRKTPFNVDSLPWIQREQFEVLVAELKACPDYKTMLERKRLLIKNQHPLVNIYGAFERADYLATLHFENKPE